MGHDNAADDMALPVVSILVEDPTTDRVLLQIRSKASAGRFRGLYEIPQGKVGAGETLLDAAARELEDECGLTDFVPRESYGTRREAGEDLAAIETLVVRETGYHSFMAVCLVGTASGTPRPSSEAENPAWYTSYEIKALIAEGNVFPLNVPMLEWHLNRSEDVYPPGVWP